MRALLGNCIFHFDFLVDDHSHRLTNTIIAELFDTTTNVPHVHILQILYKWKDIICFFLRNSRWISASTRSNYRIETVSNNNFAWYVPEISSWEISPGKHWQMFPACSLNVSSDFVLRIYVFNYRIQLKLWISYAIKMRISFWILWLQCSFLFLITVNSTIWWLISFIL